MTWVQGGGFPQRNGEKEERRDGETLCPRELIPARGAVRHPLANSGLVCLEKAEQNHSLSSHIWKEKGHQAKVRKLSFV